LFRANPSLGALDFGRLFALGLVFALFSFFLLTLGFHVEVKEILALVISAKFTDAVREDRLLALRTGGEVFRAERKVRGAFTLGLFCSAF
jgi:hypothetical protein